MRSPPRRLLLLFLTSSSVDWAAVLKQSKGYHLVWSWLYQPSLMLLAVVAYYEFLACESDNNQSAGPGGQKMRGPARRRDTSKVKTFDENNVRGFYCCWTEIEKKQALHSLCFAVPKIYNNGLGPQHYNITRSGVLSMQASRLAFTTTLYWSCMIDSLLERVYTCRLPSTRGLVSTYTCCTTSTPQVVQYWYSSYVYKGCLIHSTSWCTK